MHRSLDCALASLRLLALRSGWQMGWE